MKRFLCFSALTLWCIWGFSQANCSEFFFSEYVEGTSQNKALEIYNPTANARSLSGYTIKRYPNGSATADTHLDLVGSVAAYDVWVVTNGQIIPNTYGVVDTALYNLADQHGTGDHATCPMYFNGNDPVTLETTPGGVIIDIFARIGPPDPIGGWYNIPGPNGDYTTPNYWEAWTTNHTLIRKPTVLHGVTSNPSPFIVNQEWDSLPENDWSHLGWHICNCNPGAVKTYQKENHVFVFPNPVIHDEATIKATDEIVSVQMFNMLGSQVLYRENTKKSGEIYLVLNNLEPGVYMLRTVLKDKSVVIKKIIVQ